MAPEDDNGGESKPGIAGWAADHKWWLLAGGGIIVFIIVKNKFSSSSSASTTPNTSSATIGTTGTTGTGNAPPPVPVSGSGGGGGALSSDLAGLDSSLAALTAAVVASGQGGPAAGSQSTPAPTLTWNPGPSAWATGGSGTPSPVSTSTAATPTPPPSAVMGGSSNSTVGSSTPLGGELTTQQSNQIITPISIGPQPAATVTKAAHASRTLAATNQAKVMHNVEQVHYLKGS